MSNEMIEELGFHLVTQQAYSPDLARCHLEGKHLTREDQVIASVRFQKVMNDQQYRLRRCIQLEGGYLR
jgi:hypothetical protein